MSAWNAIKQFRGEILLAGKYTAQSRFIPRSGPKSATISAAQTDLQNQLVVGAQGNQILWQAYLTGRQTIANRAHQAAFLVHTDAVGFGSELRTKRLASGIDPRHLAAWLGISRDYYMLLERGELPHLRKSIVQKLCAFFDIKANYLPYCGPILSEPLEIKSDILNRLLTLGITGARARDYLGMEVSAIMQEIGERERVSAAVWEILTDKLHMRVLPPAEDKKLTEENFRDLFSRMEEYWKIWDMSDLEWMAELGHSSKSRFSQLRNNPGYKSPATEKLAEIFGWTTHHTIDSLPPIQQPTYPDKNAAQHIRQKLAELGWSVGRLAKKLGTQNHNVQHLLRRLEEKDASTPIFNDDDVFGASALLHRICRLLKIPLITISSEPVKYVKSTGNRSEDFISLAKQALETRARLRMTVKEFSRKTHVSVPTIHYLENIVASNNREAYSDRLMESVEALAAGARIEYDPFAHLQKTVMPTGTEKSIQLAKLQARMATCAISHARLRAITGLSPDERYNALHGIYDRDRPRVDTLYRLVGIVQNDPTGKQDSMSNLDLAKACGLSIDHVLRWRISGNDPERKIAGSIWQQSTKQTTLFLKTSGNALSPSASAMKNWLTDINIFFNSCQMNRPTLVTDWGLSGYLAQKLLTPDADLPYLNDPALLRLSGNVRRYFPMLMQLVIDAHMVETPGDLANWSGLSIEAIEAFPFVWPHTGIFQEPEIRARRQRLLDKELGGEVLSEDEQGFLHRTGGMLRELKLLDADDIHYRYSIGDTILAAKFLYENKNRYAERARSVGMHDAISRFHTEHLLWICYTYRECMGGARPEKVYARPFPFAPEDRDVLILKWDIQARKTFSGSSANSLTSEGDDSMDLMGTSMGHRSAKNFDSQGTGLATSNLGSSLFSPPPFIPGTSHLPPLPHFDSPTLFSDETAGYPLFPAVANEVVMPTAPFSGLIQGGLKIVH